MGVNWVLSMSRFLEDDLGGIPGTSGSGDMSWCIVCDLCCLEDR